MFKQFKRESKFRLKYLTTLVFMLNFFTTAVANTALGNAVKKISIDKSPVLHGDTLKKINPKLFVPSSLNQLSENIYFSSFTHYYFISDVLNIENLLEVNEDFLEILGLKEFYAGNETEAIHTLTKVFETTEDSSQKAKVGLNLVKIYYLNGQNTEAMELINTAKSLKVSYNAREKYDLILLEAKIALAQGLTNRAERLIISGALPMSTRIKGRYNEFNCYLFLGKIYLKAKQLTQAKWFFIQANTIAINKNYTDGKIETSLLLAKTKIQVGDKDIALQDLARARMLINDKHPTYLTDLKQLTRLANR